jgi:cytochrome c-type biogenesis protein CcmH
MGPSPRLRIVSSFSIVIAVLAVAFASPNVAIANVNQQEANENMPAPGERALIGRLVAPCCWQQTLDVHTGPVADTLRAEVRMRLWAGETTEGIEADFAARYGARVRAVPQGNPIVGVSLGMVVFSLLAASGLFIVVRRWRRAGQQQKVSSSPSPSETARDVYDERIDDELRSMSS